MASYELNRWILLQVNVTSLTANETLVDSELTKLDLNNTSPKEIKLAFCREVARTARIYSPPPGIYSWLLFKTSFKDN